MLDQLEITEADLFVDPTAIDIPCLVRVRFTSPYRLELAWTNILRFFIQLKTGDAWKARLVSIHPKRREMYLAPLDNNVDRELARHAVRRSPDACVAMIRISALSP